jgi:Cytochrome C oxidase, cbb3-type, subunit III
MDWMKLRSHTAFVPRAVKDRFIARLPPDVPLLCKEGSGEVDCLPDQACKSLDSHSVRFAPCESTPPCLPLQRGGISNPFVASFVRWQRRFFHSSRFSKKEISDSSLWKKHALSLLKGGVRGDLWILALLTVCLSIVGCQQKMADQPRYKPLQRSDFFTDQRSARPIVEGTVARGDLEADEFFYTGKVNGNLVDRLPFPVTKELLLRGQERYNIFCSPCHDQVGTGQGMVVRRGYRPPPSLHIDRLRTAPDGYFFDVMTHGFGAMPDYAEQVPPADRWVIVAYIRALQFSQNAKVGDLPEKQRQALSENKK